MHYVKETRAPERNILQQWVLETKNDLKTCCLVKARFNEASDYNLALSLQEQEVNTSLKKWDKKSFAQFSENLNLVRNPSKFL